MRRRDFIEVIGAGTLLLGCEEEGLTDGGAGADSGGALDAGPPAPFRGVSKGPFVQLLSPGRARLRFETRLDQAFEVTITRAGSSSMATATRSPTELTYERDALGMMRYLPDEPGLHVVHETIFEGLTPGEHVAWTVTPLEGDALMGSFTAPVAPDMPFRLGWLADTSFPIAEEPIGALAAAAPDVVIHGGDITYQANPFDTWNGMTAGMAPLFRSAPTHFCVGNHEFENGDEISVQFDRLFSGQGDAGAMPRYFAFTYGSVRFLCIDTESGNLEEMDTTQLAWLDAELAAATADANIRFPIVGFHRPTYTLSRHAPGNTVVRDLLHTKFVASGVPLVLAGHSHAYERFVVDGIHYVIDGGGGAILYDPNEEAAEVETMRPGEGALRQAVSMSLGVTTVDIGADGSLDLQRLAAADGSVLDQVLITP